MFNMNKSVLQLRLGSMGKDDHFMQSDTVVQIKETPSNLDINNTQLFILPAP